MSEKRKISLDEVAGCTAAALPLAAPLIAAVAAHPEVAFEEHFAADLQEKFLSERGFAVTRPMADLPTVVWGEYSAVETPGPAVAVLTEFDALPGLGHACGHELIMGAGLMALAALRDLMAKHQIPGRLIAACCPGEEQKGGKVRMLNAGLFDKVDAAFSCHPFSRNGVSSFILAVSRFTVEFFGRSAHASTNPAMGINALDAMNLFFAGINAWRQQLPASARVHGIVTNGGQAPNAIPEYTAGYFYLRSDNNAMQKRLEARFADIAQGAALMTGCRAEVKAVDHPYSASKPNAALSRMILDVMAELNMPVTDAPSEPFSTDFANVCDAVPGAVVGFDVTGGAPLALHSAAFREAAASPEALAPTRNAGTVMATTALRFLTDGEFREQVRQSGPLM